MLKSLKLKGIGPVKDLSASFGDRLNVLTGDNGLGKSFLLDVAFWALTGTWASGRLALPEANGKKNVPSIAYELAGKKKTGQNAASFDFHNQSWQRENGRPTTPGLVVYAAVDGSFAVWDPAKNFWRNRRTGQVVPSDPARAYQFTSHTIEKGIQEDDHVLCNGIVEDWKSWFYQSREPGFEDIPRLFPMLERVIACLSHPDEPMRPGKPRRVYVDDTRDFPTLELPYGTVSYPHFAAGMRRIVQLAYLLVWTWTEHAEAARLRREEPSDQLVLILDEAEAHLHPKWQRVIVPALLKVMESLSANVRVQLLTATHSPLVLASLEPLFKEDTDRLFRFDLEEGKVHFRNYPWAKQGDATNWLISDIFGLREARSREAEEVITAAEAFMAGQTAGLPSHLITREMIQREMARVLPGDDPIWPRWRAKNERKRAQ
jgi:hypothetical protein